MSDGNKDETNDNCKIVNCVESDITSLLHRFFSSINSLSSFTFDNFKMAWKDRNFNFGYIHHAFPVNKINYPKLLQTIFHLILHKLFKFPENFKNLEIFSQLGIYIYNYKLLFI